jgi:hypothetical protein
VGGSERASSSDASDKSCMPNVPRMLGPLFAFALFEFEPYGIGEGSLGIRELAAPSCRWASGGERRFVKVGDSSNCKCILCWLLVRSKLGEACSGSGLSVGSFLELYVANGVNGEAVGRLGDERLVAGVIGSSSFAA